MRVAHVSGSKGRPIECVVMRIWKYLINAKQAKKLMQAFLSKIISPYETLEYSYLTMFENQSCSQTYIFFCTWILQVKIVDIV